MKLVILYGGKSGEHEVSLVSAAGVVRTIAAEHRIYLVGIDRNGIWRLQPDGVLATCREGDGPLELRTDCPEVVIAPGRGLRVYGAHGQTNLQVDVVFPVLHGSFGEDGTVQGLLECAELAYVGADVLGSALGMDKAMAKDLWRGAGLPVLPHVVVGAADLAAKGAAAIGTEVESRLGWPAFVKPVRAGSSVGAHKAEDAAAFATAVADALRFDTKVLVEPFVQARELECSVIGNDEPRAFEPGEVVPTHEFYDYDAKYVDPDGARLVIPADVDPAVRARVRELAVAAYRTAGLSGMARVDFFMDRNDGTLYLNEVNTLPGFTPISMFPKMCEAGGLPYPALIETLFALARERHETRKNLAYTRS